MSLLCLNTAFSKSDVGLYFNDKTDFLSLDSNSKQSENILVCVDKLLKNNSINIDSINNIAVVVGPGSFTGIRIGIGIVKGICFAKKNIKTIPVCSLDLMAHTFFKKSKKHEFACIINALSGNVFVCSYENGKRKTEPKLVKIADFNKTCTVVGLLDENLALADEFVEFSAKELLDYALKLYNENVFVTHENLLPLYLRNSQAEEQL